MRPRLARRIARRYGVEVMVSTGTATRATVLPADPPHHGPLAVVVLRPTDTLATFRASVRGACTMLRAHVVASLPGDMEVTEARAIVDALPWGPR